MHLCRAHTHTHAHANRRKVFGLKLGFCGWVGAMFNAAASRKSCLCALRWVTGREWSAVGVPRGSVVGAAVRLQVLKNRQ